MTEENNNKMMVYAVELIKGENVAISTSGIRYVSKNDFLHDAYNIINWRLVDCRCFEYKGTEYDAFTLICDNFLIAKCNEDGETIGITKEEANDLATFLKENTRKLKQAYDKGLFGGKKQPE